MEDGPNDDGDGGTLPRPRRLVESGLELEEMENRFAYDGSEGVGEEWILVAWCGQVGFDAGSSGMARRRGGFEGVAVSARFTGWGVREVERSFNGIWAWGVSLQKRDPYL